MQRNILKDFIFLSNRKALNVHLPWQCFDLEFIQHCRKFGLKACQISKLQTRSSHFKYLTSAWFLTVISRYSTIEISSLILKWCLFDLFISISPTLWKSFFIYDNCTRYYDQFLMQVTFCIFNQNVGNLMASFYVFRECLCYVIFFMFFLCQVKLLRLITTRKNNRPDFERKCFIASKVIKSFHAMF